MPPGQRYYSQTYDPVDNPSAASSNVRLDDYADHSPARNPFSDNSVQQPHPAPSPLAYDDHDPFDKQQPRPKAGWSRRRKLVIFGSIAAALVIIAIIIGVAVALTSGGSYSYTPSTVKVTNDEAFTDGGARKGRSNNITDGIGAGKDEYTYYSGNASNFPAASAWMSFEDMWAGNLHTLQTSCKTLGEGSNNSPKIISEMYNAIQNRANASLVDHRFIFAVILQESHGCVHVKSTTSPTGVSNPGLMQSHNGHSFSSSHSNASIYAMVQDGTQGTSAGEGLVQNLNNYGNAYSAARGYNSGYIPTSGNLSAAAGATACYVSDIANRLTGWANATNKCTGSS